MPNEIKAATGFVFRQGSVRLAGFSDRGPHTYRFDSPADAKIIQHTQTIEAGAGEAIEVGEFVADDRAFLGLYNHGPDELEIYNGDIVDDAQVSLRADEFAMLFVVISGTGLACRKAADTLPTRLEVWLAQVS